MRKESPKKARMMLRIGSSEKSPEKQKNLFFGG